MPPVFDQSNRLAKLFTPLADGTVVLLDMHGSEYVNGINSFHVRALTGHAAADIEGLMGQPMSIELTAPSGGKRHIHQVVDAVHYVGREDQNHVYEFELRPWLWMLGRRINSRIFKEESVVDIIKKVVQEHGLPGSMTLKDDVTGANGAVEYLVQYNESDLDFLRRLMEREGINFHCEMTQNGHSIVLSNRTDSFPEIAGGGVSFSPLGDRGDQTTENFDNWMPRRQLTTGATRMTDYNFKTPKAGMEASSASSQSFPFSNFESFVYPGNYLTSGEGRAIAKQRGDAARTADATVMADGNVVRLGAGMRVELLSHPDTSQQGTYVVMAAHHAAANGSFRSGQGSGEQQTYRGSYQLCRSSIPVAPPLQTARPRIIGPQTAVVVDGANGQIDEWGRITVKFHWAPDAESMRCRVSQIWAGPEWGSIFVPHTGMEVIVEFLDGNPDQPLITGCVWNQDNRPTFPGAKLLSGFKTVRDNRLFFIDEEGAEQIQIRAQKDMLTVVMKDDKHIVHQNRTTTIDDNVTETVGGNVSSTVKGSITQKADKSITIESKEKIELKVGSSSIVIDQGSITIKAATITVEATTALTTKSNLTAEHSSSGMMVIKGSIVNIN